MILNSFGGIILHALVPFLDGVLVKGTLLFGVVDQILIKKIKIVINDNSDIFIGDP